jgi:hypothetical protein
MQRVIAKFLLLFALAGTFVPLALAATAAPPHVCCLRKAVHQCHGSDADTSIDQRIIRSSACCNQQSCRAVTTSRSACPQTSLSVAFAQTVKARIADSRPEAPATKSLSTQSTRGPPHVSIA